MRLSKSSTTLAILCCFCRVSKRVIRNQLSILFISGAFVAGSAVAAAAQTTPVPLVFSTANGGGSGTTTLTGLPTTTTTDATLSLDAFGDLDFTGVETLAVRLDGVLVATITGTPSCTGPGPVSNTSINVTQAVLTPLIADGQIVVSYQASAGVQQVGCPALLGAPPNASFGVSGSLTYTGPVVVVPPAAGAASASVSRFLGSRARSLVQNQPDVVRFVDGRTAGNFNAQVTRGNGNLDFLTGANGPFWASLQGSWSDDTAGDQSYVLGSFGGHTHIGSNAIVGAMLQIDYAERSETGIADTEGTGWLVGPYFAAQLGNHPLYLDGRLLYGTTDNAITPSGAAKDKFDGERWLATLGLEGKIQANNLAIFPGIDVSYVKDGQDAYVDSTSALIAAQNVEQTEVAFGLDFETPMSGTAGDMVLTWGASGIWSETNGSGPSAAIVQFDDGWRGRLDLGFRYEGSVGLRSDANAFVDGLGNGEESYGLSFTVGFTF